MDDKVSHEYQRGIFSPVLNIAVYRHFLPLQLLLGYPIHSSTGNHSNIIYPIDNITIHQKRSNRGATGASIQQAVVNNLPSFKVCWSNTIIMHSKI